jgi:hypothetical protein
MRRVPRFLSDRITFFMGLQEYPDGEAAVADSWRAAVLLSSRAVARDRDRVRAAAIGAVNRRRDPRARTPRVASTRHRVAWIAAFLAFLLALGHVAIPPRRETSVLDLDEGLFPTGLVSLAAFGMCLWLEPVRASGSLWGRAHAYSYLVFAFFDLGMAYGVVFSRWDEVNPRQPEPVVAGVVMWAAAGLGYVALWWWGRRADKAGDQAGLAAATRDLIDQADAPEVFDLLDEWWRTAGPSALAANPEGVREIRAAILRSLRAGHLIKRKAERAALAEGPPRVWTERRR